MSNIKSTDEPGERFAKLMADLYYFMAREMVDRLGEEQGEEAILAAVRKFGQSRVEAMKIEALERGLDLNSLETYKQVRDMPGDGWEIAPGSNLDFTRCPMAEAWAQHGAKGRQLGYLYCQIDHVLYNAFDVKLERPLCLAKGDACCRFILTEK